MPGLSPKRDMVSKNGSVTWKRYIKISPIKAINMIVVPGVLLVLSCILLIYYMAYLRFSPVVNSVLSRREAHPTLTRKRRHLRS